MFYQMNGFGDGEVTIRFMRYLVNKYEKCHFDKRSFNDLIIQWARMLHFLLEKSQCLLQLHSGQRHVLFILETNGALYNFTVLVISMNHCIHQKLT